MEMPRSRGPLPCFIETPGLREEYPRRRTRASRQIASCRSRSPFAHRHSTRRVPQRQPTTARPDSRPPVKHLGRPPTPSMCWRSADAETAGTASGGFDGLLATVFDFALASCWLLRRLGLCILDRHLLNSDIGQRYGIPRGCILGAGAVQSSKRQGDDERCGGGAAAAGVRAPKAKHRRMTARMQTHFGISQQI